MTMKMNPLGFFADLMTSKYFLLFVALISAMNIIGYMSMGYIDAVMLFAMVAYLTFVFSKNMTVVLLVAVIVVNLYMHTMPSREGISSGESKGRGGSNGNDTSSANVGSVTGFKGMEGITDMKNVMTDDDGVEIQEAPDVEISEITVEQPTGDEYEEGEEETATLKEGVKSKTEKSGFNNMSPHELDAAPKKQSSHIDYGTTLSDAYKNLEKMLGEGGLQNLTADTKKLMEQQSKLFNSMENIAPLLAQAQTMMKGMNLTGANNVKKEGFGVRGKVGGIADYAEEIN